jgi:hypothetical protein
MKNIIALTLLFAFTITMHSQEPSMKKGSVVIYLGAGAGSGYFGTAKYKGVGFTYRSSPTIHLGFEYGFSEAIPKSILGLGANITTWFGSYNYRDSWGDGWNVRWSDITVLARGYYHHEFLVGEKWDVYASPMVGLKFRTYSYTYNDPYYSNSHNSDAGVYPAFGVALGGRYYVSKAFGFYAELSQGYNVDYAKIGFAFKF